MTSVTYIVRQFSYGERLRRLFKYTAVKPRTKYEMLIYLRKRRQHVSDHAIKRQINSLISSCILRPCGTRPSKRGRPSEIRRFILNEKVKVDPELREWLAD